MSGVCSVHGKQNWGGPRWYSEAQSSNACICSQWKVRTQLMQSFFWKTQQVFCCCFFFLFFSFLFFFHITSYIWFSFFLVGNIFNSIEQAQASHVYSYKHAFRGFAAKLTNEQAYQISSQWTFTPFLFSFFLQIINTMISFTP